MTRDGLSPRQSAGAPSYRTILVMASTNPAKCREDGSVSCGRCCAAMFGVGYRHASADRMAAPPPPAPLLMLMLGKGMWATARRFIATDACGWYLSALVLVLAPPPLAAATPLVLLPLPLLPLPLLLLLLLLPTAPSRGSKRHRMAFFSARLLVKYVFWQHVARFVAASERACCRGVPVVKACGGAGTAFAFSLPFPFPLRLLGMADDADADADCVGGGTCDEGMKSDSGDPCVCRRVLTTSNGVTGEAGVGAVAAQNSGKEGSQDVCQLVLACAVLPREPCWPVLALPDDHCELSPCIITTGTDRARTHSLVKLVTTAPLHAAMILCLSLFRERACRRLALSSCSSSVLIVLVIGDMAGASTGSAGMLRLAILLRGRCNAMRLRLLSCLLILPRMYVSAAGLWRKEESR